MGLSRYDDLVNKNAIYRKYASVDLNESNQNFVGEYYNNDVRARWRAWFASAQNKLKIDNFEKAVDDVNDQLDKQTVDGMLTIHVNKANLLKFIEDLKNV